VRRFFFFLQEAGARWRRNESVIICTDNFSIYEIIQIMNILRIKFSIESTIHYDNNYPRIYILKHSMPILLNLVNPFIFPSMQYKFKGRKKNFHLKKIFIF
jgi:hypothetical protein